jgi:adenosylcobinamide-phosphate synthase
LKRGILLPVCYLADQLLGDPNWLPHPVRLMGAAISRGESGLRRKSQTPASELVAGALLSITVVVSSYWLTTKVIDTARHHSPALSNSIEILLGWTCLAARSLDQEAQAVIDALHDDNLILARHRLARIVGRDTDDLNAQEISRAVIETIAESSSDGIIAPMLYMVIGGVPLAMGYKAINTLDSMIGHSDTRYFYFGKFAARLDDAANLLPARLTALCLIAASCLLPDLDPCAAWQTWRRDGGKHKSPNAGHPESAMSGALKVALGGNNTYAGELVPGQRIGQEYPPAKLDQASKSLRLASTASLLVLGTAAIFATLIQFREQPR